ncbi:osteocalcin 2-like [Littorina saxatilis]|uniref:Uncharacterized protein n=1 Tax=Littorina saxatilis TaxID=31220 RepID=A0AAN9GA59_9CAEN
MAPTCDTLSRCSDNTASTTNNNNTTTQRSPVSAKTETTSKTSSSSTSSKRLLDVNLCLEDPEPFYGMFNSSETEADWAHIRLSSPRCGTTSTSTSTSSTRSPSSSPSPPSSSIPEASETFQRAMKQLGEVQETAGSRGGARPKDKKTSSSSTSSASSSSSSSSSLKSSKVVKKSASFSAAELSSSSSSSSSSDAAGSLAAEVKRRMSVPCVRSSKHVQWVDQAGVAQLVSVRLIRPRLAKGEKEETRTPSPSRSILRRLTGRH